MSDKSVAMSGGGFLVADPEPGDIFIPEHFTEEQLMIGRTCDEFVQQKVRPRIDEIEEGDHELSLSLLRESGELGLLGGDVPEAYGGLGLDKVSTTLVAEKLAGAGSFAITAGAHSGIGTLPLVFFGNEEQKSRYLPSLATGEVVAAYALTEPDAGSDALGGKATATLSDDGKSYRLNGQKQWITNSGFADLLTVYAKVDGEKMTAFLVERGFDGVSVGPEHKKMGIRGSSTCDVYFNDAVVPIENVLGEIGRGHIIAFNILNIGRWKLGALCLGSCKAVLGIAARYASQRQQFGKPIAVFPAIQQKLAQMAARTFALESVVYRTAGLYDQGLAVVESDGDGAKGAAEAIAEYALEASINKVLGSETLDFVVDEGVQIHGGYGFIQEFEIERAYRDARISRLFEGTNEINRLLIPASLMRRATKGELPLMAAIQRVQQEITSLQPATSAGVDGPLSAQAQELANAKRATLMVAGLGVQKYLNRMEEEQEFLMGAADLAITVFAWESALLRAQQLVGELGEEGAGMAVDLARLYGDLAATEAEITARRTLAGMEEGDTLQTQLAILRRLFRRVPVNNVTLGRRIAQSVLGAGGYVGVEPSVLS